MFGWLLMLLAVIYAWLEVPAPSQDLQQQQPRSSSLPEPETDAEDDSVME